MAVKTLGTRQKAVYRQPSGAPRRAAAPLPAETAGRPASPRPASHDAAPQNNPLLWRLLASA